MLDLTTIRGLIFDLDGTLVDSAPDLALAVNRMLSQLHLGFVGEGDVRRWVGNGSQRLVHRVLTRSMSDDADPALFASAYPLFLDYYADCCCDNTRLYPGVLDGLGRVRDLGIKTACVTNKPLQFAKQVVAATGIEKYFDLLLGGDSLAAKKPSPVPFFYVAETFDLLPQQLAVVGDSVNDVEAARAANMQSICVPYGYNHGHDIRESEADLIIESIRELPKLFEWAA